MRFVIEKTINKFVVLSSWELKVEDESSSNKVPQSLAVGKQAIQQRQK